MQRIRQGRFAALGLAVTVILVATACEPIENAPPGGGETIVETYQIGPFDLAPMGQPGSEDEGFQASVPRPPGGFGMKSINFDLVLADDGSSVPSHDAHLHHIVMMNPERRSMYCSNWPERFAASGQERTPGSLPDPYAYMVGENERWDAIWHVMNMSDEPMEVYIEYTVGYQPGATEENSRAVTPFFLDVTGCGNSEYTVPGDGGPGSVHENVRTLEVPWDGYIVTAGGHVHERGIEVALRDEASGNECNMRAIYHDHHGGGHTPPDRITTCPIHVSIDEGQEFSIVSRYHNDMPVAGAMGIVLAYAWPGRQ